MINYKQVVQNSKEKYETKGNRTTNNKRTFRFS